MLQTPKLIIRHLGLQDYEPTWRAMREFTDTRDGNSTSEAWLLQHPPVFTQGQAGKAQHVLNPGDIPIVQVDRGGQVTYHGPGQLVVYLLLSLKETGNGIRSLVRKMEDAVIAFLADCDIAAVSRRDAPGVYVDDAKIAALGLRVRRGYTFHGLALNVDMDLEPYARINPCGYAGMAITQMKDQGVNITVEQAADQLIRHLCEQIGYASPNT